MAVLQLEPSLEAALSVYHNKNCYALLLGSGVSKSANIPTGWDITLKLVQELAARTNTEIKTPEETISWYREAYQTSEEPNYSTVMETIGGTSDSRKGIIRGFIELDGSLPKPSKGHQVIARLIKAGFFRIVITTNFDPLLEIALTEQGIQFEAISTIDQIKTCTPRAHQAIQIFKIHGDYRDARMRNIDKELQGGYDRVTKALLKELFNDFGIITCGWSGKWDESLASALKASQSKRFPFYFCNRGELTAEANEIISEKEGKMIPISSSDEFFENLETDLKALTKINEPPSISAQVAAERTKLFMSEEIHSINLRDHVMKISHDFKNESDLYLINLEDGKLPSIQKCYELCNELVKKSEACTAVLTNLGFYAKERHFALVIEALLTLAEENLILKGYDQNIAKLAYFPSLIGLYSVGLPLFLHKEYKLLGQILKSEVSPNFPFKWVASVPHIMAFDSDYSLEPSRLLKATIQPVLKNMHMREGEIEQLFENFEAFLSYCFINQAGKHYERRPSLNCKHFWHGEFMIKNTPVNRLKEEKDRIPSPLHILASEMFSKDRPEYQVEKLVADFEKHREFCPALTRKP